MAVLLLVSCAETKFVPESRYLLNEVKVKIEGEHNRDLDATTAKNLVRQKENVKWFSFVKLPLKVYSLSGRDSTRWMNRLLRSLGEEPVLYDSLKASMSCNDLQMMLQSKGYLTGRVELWTRTKGKKLWTYYKLKPGPAFRIGTVNYQIVDPDIDQTFHLSDLDRAGLVAGQPFSLELLENERKRITQLLTNNGYYRFHKEYIHYEADTLGDPCRVNLKLLLSIDRNEDVGDVFHRRYRIRSLTFESGTKQDSVIHLRQNVLNECCYIKKDDYYSARDLQNTYNHFARLGAVRYTNISFSESPDSAALDCNIQLQTNKPSTLSFQPEGTNTAGDLGAAATLTYQNRNLFRGSENLSVELRGAYEAIKGLEGYTNQDFIEYSLETRLRFPRFIMPFISYDTRRRVNATSEVALLYDLQDRPEFHRRLLSAGWRYRWAPQDKPYQYQFDVLDLNYVFMPWISETFYQQYLADVSSRNAILRYNYQDLFITKTGLGFTFTNCKTALKTNLETSGNVLYAASNFFGAKKNEQGQDMVFNIAYAQYVKGDIDLTRIIQLDYTNQLVCHVGLGIACPYGNSSLLPFEKRYFSGGANSLRGWSVRSIGPGKYKGTDGRIDFINQTGDMKLDLNLEYRTHLFWKLDGALFVDAGNIWTLRNYPDQSGGQFSFSTFLSELAANYGLGFRFNFGYFIVRFDLGMKAVNPSFEADGEEHYAILHPRFSRDFAFHFAVGLPF